MFTPKSPIGKRLFKEVRNGKGGKPQWKKITMNTAIALKPLRPGMYFTYF
jgi:hypothetical protein